MNESRLIAALKVHEGEKRNARGAHIIYRCPAGKATIGWGRNLSDNGISNSEAEFMLRNDIQSCINDLDRALPWWKTLDSVRQEALVNMVFNMGLPVLLGFKNMLARLEKKDFDGAAREAMNSRWFNQVGKRGMHVVHMIRHGEYPAELQNRKD